VLGKTLGQEFPERVNCIVPLDTDIAYLVADLHREHKLATADAIMYASAQQQGADLLTCDAHFEGVPGLVLFAKA
jgi:predicted nucleic acid-binding protein